MVDMTMSCLSSAASFVDIILVVSAFDCCGMLLFCSGHAFIIKLHLVLATW